MNADKMTREEALKVWRCETKLTFEEFWSRIQAIQSAPFVPDWKHMPDGFCGFRGMWTTLDGPSKGAGEFYIPAPSNPTDAELSAMFDKLDMATKKRALEAVRKEE